MNNKKRIEFKVKTKMSKSSIFEIEDLIDYARKIGQDAIAITDYNSVETFHTIYSYLKKNNITDFKVIYGAIVKMIENDCIIPVTIIVKNKIGLKNLYKIISNIKTNNLEKYGKQVITKDELVEFEEGLLYGLDTSYMYEIYECLTDNQIIEDMRWYDFIEVRPKSCISFDNSEEYLKRIINLADSSRKLIIATGDVHYLEEKEKKAYEKLFPNKDHHIDRHLKSTEEMIKEFSFLEDYELVNKIVVNNPQKIASLVEKLEIKDDKVYLPKIENSKEKILSMIYDRAYSLYGNPLPNIVQKRIDDELYGKDSGILGLNHESIYLIAYELVKYSNKLGYLVGARGGVASSFIAYLIGITSINSLPSHYRCPDCKISIFQDELEQPLSEKYNCGVDMANKKCPNCNKDLIKDGFNIPYEVFLGSDASKIPDIDLNFSDEIQQKVQNYLKDLFGESHVIKAGTIGKISCKNAYDKVNNYCVNNNLNLSEVEKKKLTFKIEGNKRINGQHPGGILIIPNDMDVYDFTPISYPADNVNCDFKISNFDYHDIDNNITKFDILGHSDMTRIKRLENLTGVKASNIPLDDRKTMNLFTNGKTLAIPEFDSSFIRNMIEKIKPSKFEDLIKISSLAHSTGGWIENAEELISNGIPFKEIIGSRDDIMNYLIKHNIEQKISFEIMEFVRKGRANIKKYNEMWMEYKNLMMDAGVPDWYINSCEKIKYLFPKSHSASYVINSFRIAWYKVHFPLEFYCSYFSRIDFSAYEFMTNIDILNKQLSEIESKKTLSLTDEKLLNDLKVIKEALSQGILLKLHELKDSNKVSCFIDKKTNSIIINKGYEI